MLDRGTGSQGGEERVGSHLVHVSKRTCILILGMHRSGTSALTRVVSMLGAKLPADLIVASEGNETGHWEPTQLNAYHDKFLAELGSRWDDWRRLDLGRLPARRRSEFKVDVRGHLESDYGDAPLIVVKEPRICRFAPLFLEVLDDVGFDTRIIVPFRNPLEVAASLEKRSKFWAPDQSQTYASLLWLRHVLDAEAATRGRVRSFLPYDSLLADWKGACATLTKQLDMSWPYAIDEIATRVDRFLTLERRHHRRTVEDVLLSPSTQGWTAEVFEAMHVLEHNPTSRPALTTLDRIRREFDHAAPVMERMHAEVRDRHLIETRALQGTLAEAEAKAFEHQEEVESQRHALANLERTRDEFAVAQVEREKEVERLSAALSQAESRATEVAADLAVRTEEATRHQAALAERERELARLSRILRRPRARQGRPRAGR